jgi:hypothetical protein
VDECHPSRQWLLQPLVEAGLEPERIRTLVYRLAFESVVGQGAPSVDRIRAVVADQPPLVRAAWTEVIARMLVWTEDPASAPEPASPPPASRVTTVAPRPRVPGDG